MAEDWEGLIEDVKNLLRSRGLDEATVNSRVNALRQPRRDEGTTSEQLGRRVEQLAVSPDKRKFTVTGSVDKSSRGKCFFVKLTESNSDLCKKAHSGDCVMLHGPRAVGKSTRMLQACDDLASEFHCMNVSLHDVDTSNVPEFWKSLSLSLVGKCNQLGVKQVRSGSKCSRMWNTRSNAGLVSDKKFVLFIDEFDSLVDTPGNLNASILGTFRGLKQSAESHRLHCVVIVRVFSIVRLNAKRSSPFNFGDAVAAPFLTLEQVNEMFGDCLGCRGFPIDAEVINDICERTGGHAGLVNLCGKAIDEEIRPKAISKSVSRLTLPAWLEALRCRLKMWLVDFPTVKRIVTDLTTDGELQASCRKALCDKFLCRDAPVPSDAVDIATLDCLKSVGMVQEMVPGEVVTSNSMVRMLAVWCVLPCDRRDMSLGAPPVTRECNLDVLSLLLKSAQHFPVADLCGAVRWSFKRAGRGSGRRVPHEHHCQSQLASIIRAWPSDAWRFFPEVRKEVDRKRIDFVVETVDESEDRRFVLELVATSSNTELNEHYTSAQKHGQMTGSHHVWVVHFCAVKLESEALPKPPKGVHALHLIHEGTDNDIVWSALCHGAQESKTLALDISNFLWQRQRKPPSYCQLVLCWNGTSQRGPTLLAGGGKGGWMSTKNQFSNCDLPQHQAVINIMLHEENLGDEGGRH